MDPHRLELQGLRAENARLRADLAAFSGELRAAALEIVQPRVLERIACGAPLEETAQLLLQAVAPDPAELIALVCALDPERAGLRLLGAADLTPECRAALEQIELLQEPGQLGQAVRQGTALFIEEPEREGIEPELCLALRPLGQVALWSLPARDSAGLVQGCLLCLSRRAATPSATQRQDLLAAARLAGLALEREQVERSRRESVQRLDIALGAAGMCAWDWDVGTGRMSFDRRGADWLGYAPQELGTRADGWTRLIHIEDQPLALRLLREHLRGDLPVYRSEQRLRAQDGQWKWMLVCGQVYRRGEHGQPLRMAGAFIDISGRKAVELALQRSEDELLETQRIGRLGSLDWEAISDRLRASAQACRNLGCEPGHGPETLAGFIARILAEDRAGIEEWLRQWARKPEFGTRELRVRWPDGQEHRLRCTLEPRFDERRVLGGFRGVLQDVTEIEHSRGE